MGSLSIYAMNDHLIFQAEILVQRLERLSADSPWAHRASGLRAALDKALTRVERGEESATDDLRILIKSGFDLIEKAAQEIPES